MSLKKDNFNNFDKRFMKLAFNLAINQKGLTGINPSVGCVIVKNKKIVSFGVTNISGRPHAETIALNRNIKENIGSTVYLTLEPCSHYGETPPCTKALIKSRVKKVAELYNCQYSKISDLSALKACIQDSFKNKGIQIIEAKIYIKDNVNAHKNFMEKVEKVLIPS